MLRFKIDILQALKDKGYNTTVLRTEKLLGETAIQSIRTGKVPGTKSITSLCELLKMQPGQFLEWIPDKKD